MSYKNMARSNSLELPPIIFMRRRKIPNMIPDKCVLEVCRDDVRCSRLFVAFVNKLLMRDTYYDMVRSNNGSLEIEFRDPNISQMTLYVYVVKAAILSVWEKDRDGNVFVLFGG